MVVNSLRIFENLREIFQPGGTKHHCDVCESGPCAVRVEVKPHLPRITLAHI